MASGNTLDAFLPGEASLNVPSPATLDLDAQGNLVYSFSNLAAQSLYLDGYLGHQYGGSGIKITLVWLCPAATGTVTWSAQFQREYAGFVLSGSNWSSAVVAQVTVPGIAYTLVYTTLTFAANVFTTLPGEIYRLSIARTIAETTVAPAPAELIRVVITEV